MRIIVKTVEETQAIAGLLAKNIQPGDTILLNGDLGAGKTTFTQGFAKALGIQRPLKSPTFTLVREYQTMRFPLYHLDVYRLGEEGGADELGLEDYFGREGVALIEWPAFIADLLPQDVVSVTLERVLHDETNQQRVIDISGSGPRSQSIVAAMEK
ncbi:tRNA (adenosine(37)-N6)-threonylcarbamoyltransferase complex ATPase subunit type 1 TsaE [Weissella diestrammenae]|uniref:tRNA threonylcarbamoyladenosine biosynthesis protein TsaE n=1 Tax=Weissella diestrammenae TaxID=1162633 RepID=A0A7G9T410_9LACO|nr:tRNA (adenosine(37)-N6)-threonylcarbamoyltransferase complex ATPase subunit type 1 TsaE [Weissella diestrammenae]MCM0583033.1 tRNA (adenosine(37)-N6)-threonylcarbamoyltransferase complex ATPase subunit type 1 TsaE [Weissella diestrammenae]QNN74835.1 tRNA (adenosine(37)-N6)-threonylcarbamoyltransferase complex ATPase subunit type 1 TsaE [Weissella diestrammenae]